jgi:hypothetical protein
MNTIRIQRLTIHDDETDAAEARRSAMRLVEVIGETLAAVPALRSRRHTTIAIQVPSGLPAEALASYIARQIRARLV